MNETTFSKIQELFAGIAELLSKMGGIGFWVFLAGFIILVVLAMVLIVRLIVSLIRIIPNLTVNQFIKLVLVLAIVLIVAGLFMP